MPTTEKKQCPTEVFAQAYFKAKADGKSYSEFKNEIMKEYDMKASTCSVKLATLRKEFKLSTATFKNKRQKKTGFELATELECSISALQDKAKDWTIDEDSATEFPKLKDWPTQGRVKAKQPIDYASLAGL